MNSASLFEVAFSPEILNPPLTDYEIQQTAIYVIYLEEEDGMPLEAAITKGYELIGLRRALGHWPPKTQEVKGKE